MLKRIVRLPSGLISIVLLTLVVLLAFLGPLLAPYDPYQGSENVLAGPSASHFLGTDYLGRDTLSRLMHGAPMSIFSAILVGLIALIVGVVPGILSVYLGRSFEWVSLRIIDTLIALPFLILAVAITALLGNSVVPAMCAVGFLTAPLFFRVTRASTMQISTTPYVEAAQLAGSSLGWIIGKHVWSKLLPSISIVLANTLGIGLVSVAALSFLGIGIQPPEPIWGGVLAADLNYLTQRPFAPVYPALLIVLTVWALNMLADAIRDVSGERQTGRRKSQKSDVSSNVTTQNNTQHAENHEPIRSTS